MPVPPPGPFKLLAIDLDGTIVPHGGTMAPECITWVARARERGLEVVIATGRRFATTRPVMEALSVDAPAVVQNGALVMTRDGTRLHARYLDNDTQRAAVLLLKQLGFAPVVYVDGTGGPGEFYLEAGAPDPTGYLRLYTQSSRGQFSVVQDLATTRLKAVTRVIAVDSPERLSDARAVLEEQLGDELRSFVTHDPHYDVKRLELMHRSASKLSGIEFVAERLGLGLRDVVAIGDDVNDLEMIAHAGFGVAVQNACAEVKAVAAHVTSAPVGPGFIEMLRWLLGEP